MLAITSPDCFEPLSADPHPDRIAASGVANTAFAELLHEAHYPITPDLIIDNQMARHDFIDSAFTHWTATDSRRSKAVHGVMIVLANTIEARDPNCNDRVLESNVARFLDTMAARPTLIHVTPKVVSVLRDDDYAAEYLQRMLAKPTEDGWMPVNDEERLIRHDWALRFKDRPVFDTIIHQGGLMAK